MSLPISAWMCEVDGTIPIYVQVIRKLEGLAIKSWFWR